LTHPVTDLSPVTDLESVRPLQQKVVDIHVDQAIVDYVSHLVEESRAHPNVRIGVSPRGTLALYKAAQARAALNGRDYVVPDDVKLLCQPVFSKRLILTNQATIRGIGPESIIASLLDNVPTPIVPEPTA
jgi:MoxR-like ATPase